jgi:transcriptional regulator with XRE-family HTH domain
MKVDINQRTGLRKLRTGMQLPQNKLAAMACVSASTVLRYENCKQVSEDSDRRIAMALFEEAARRNPEKIEQAAQPLREALQKIPTSHPLHHFLLTVLENLSLPTSPKANPKRK